MSFANWVQEVRQRSHPCAEQYYALVFSETISNSPKLNSPRGAIQDAHSPTLPFGPCNQHSPIQTAYEPRLSDTCQVGDFTPNIISPHTSPCYSAEANVHAPNGSR